MYRGVVARSLAIFILYAADSLVRDCSKRLTSVMR